MRDMPTPLRTRGIAAALMLAAASLVAPAVALEPLAPVTGSKPAFKNKHYSKHHDGGLTIIIIDRDKRPTSTVPKPEIETAATPPAPTSRIERDEDKTRIIIKTRTPSKPSGPKVIVIGKGDDGQPCKTGGVCVIRP